MRAAILQPSYLPWPGHFFWAFHCDTFIFLDDVQFTRRDWRNRNKIKTAKGPQWLTVPIITKGKFNQIILETKIDNSINWRKKHWLSIKHHYSRAPYFKSYEMVLQEIYLRDWDYLVDLSIYSMAAISKLIGLKTIFIRSSKIKVTGTKTERLVNICKKVGATEYLTGERAKSYIKEELFKIEKIKIVYQDFKPIVYPQLYGEFVPYLSMLDMLLNCGEGSIHYLQQ